MLPEGTVHILFDGVDPMRICLLTVKFMPFWVNNRKAKTLIVLLLSILLFVAW